MACLSVHGQIMLADSQMPPGRTVLSQTILSSIRYCLGTKLELFLCPSCAVPLYLLTAQCHSLFSLSVSVESDSTFTLVLFSPKLSKNILPVLSQIENMAT